MPTVLSCLIAIQYALLFAPVWARSANDTYATSNAGLDLKEAGGGAHANKVENLSPADKGELKNLNDILAGRFPKDHPYLKTALRMVEGAYVNFRDPAERSAFARVLPHMIGSGNSVSKEDLRMFSQGLSPSDLRRVGGMLERITRMGDEAAKSAQAGAAELVRKDEPATPIATWESNPIVEFYETAQEARRDDPTASELLADYASRSKNPAKTVEHATTAIDRGSEDLQTRLLRGLAYDQLGDHEAAHEDARKVLEKDPKNAKALALYRLTRGRESTVKLESPDRVFADAGDTPSALRRAGTAHVEGRTADASPDPDKAAVLSENPKVRTAAALVRDAAQAARVGDKEAAKRHALRAITLDPENLGGYRVLAGVRASEGAHDSARKVADDGLARYPDDVQLLLTRAYSLNRLGEYTRARADAAAAVRFKPEGALGYLNRANASAGLGRREETLSDLAEAARLDSKYETLSRRAADLPPGDDLTALFDSFLGGEGLPEEREAPRPSSGPDVPYGLFAIVGGLFIAAGSLHVLTSARRRARAGPGDADAIPDTPFWRRYDVTRAVAEGGMGIVYEAYDRDLGRKVAVKRMRDELSSSPEEKERFLREARIVAGMRHPNIVEIFSVETDGPDAYLVFEFVDGRTLDEVLSEKGRLTLPQAVELFRGVCAGLEYAHGRGVVHRDLKPSNIMLDAAGTPKLTDFGVARRAEELAAGGSVETVTAAGTPYYMAPEQEQGVVRPENDVYALGVCLYEALCGDRPFQGTPGGVLLSKRDGKYLSLDTAMPGLPAAVGRVVDKALRADPNERFRSPSEFFAALEAAAA